MSRCGVDTGVEDSHGWTAEQVMVGHNSRTGPSDMLHWYNKFKPGDQSARLWPDGRKWDPLRHEVS